MYLIYAAPHQYLIRKSVAYRAVVLSLSSEQWSYIGFTCLILTAVTGYFRHPYLYATLLFVEVICDMNDGYVYQAKENGILNGYGLYLDHILDGIGASFVALGMYFLLGTTPVLCVAGLVLYYLISIHSWLYKITKVSAGQTAGVYFGVTISNEKVLSLNVDDLTVILAIIGVSRNLYLAYLTDAVLFTILLSKVCRAAHELRSTRWHA